MPVPAPPIDKRSFNELVLQTEMLQRRYSSWQPDGSDPGRALICIFARLAEMVINRLNQLPDKSFLAFLDLLGLGPLPPQPARVPLTFQLAAGSTSDARVLARTPVAAVPVEGETEPVIFETERELVATRSQLVAAFNREPGRDVYSDNTVSATAENGKAFSLFQGDQPIGHVLYLGHSGLYGFNVPKTITLRFQPAEGNESWLSALEWAYWNGTEWKTVSTVGAPARVNNDWEITLSVVPMIPATTLGGQTSAWLRGRLKTSLPRGELIEIDGAAARAELRQRELMPDAGFADGVRLDFSHTFYPFGEATPRSTFSLASDETFSKPGANVSIQVNMDSTRPARPSTDLVLAWEYWGGMDWQELGRSSPMSSSNSESPYGFTDETQAFGRDGTVTFRCPANWTLGTENDVTGFWLRARIARGNYGLPTDYQPPTVQHLMLSYEWLLPRVDTIRTRVQIQRADLLARLAFTNQLPVDLTKDFLPFGEKPKVGDTLYLASDETFSKANADVALRVSLTNPSDDGATPPPARPSDKLTLTWEFWDRDVGKWTMLGQSGPGFLYRTN